MAEVISTPKVSESAEAINARDLLSSGCVQRILDDIRPITLILDLDETLIHSSFVRPDNFAFDLNVSFSGVSYNIFVQIRPGAVEFLRRVCTCGLFDVFIFTASMSEYAVPVVKNIAPWFPQERILTRQYCRLMSPTLIVKDLTIFKRDLSRIVIVDNSAESFMLQKENGVLISTWIGDETDTALIDNVLPLLLSCAAAEDVRTVLAMP